MANFTNITDKILVIQQISNRNRKTGVWQPLYDGNINATLHLASLNTRIEYHVLIPKNSDQIQLGRLKGFCYQYNLKIQWIEIGWANSIIEMRELCQNFLIPKIIDLVLTEQYSEIINDFENLSTFFINVKFKSVKRLTHRFNVSKTSNQDNRDVAKYFPELISLISTGHKVYVQNQNQIDYVEQKFQNSYLYDEYSWISNIKLQQNWFNQKLLNYQIEHFSNDYTDKYARELLTNTEAFFPFRISDLEYQFHEVVKNYKSISVTDTNDSLDSLFAEFNIKQSNCNDKRGLYYSCLKLLTTKEFSNIKIPIYTDPNLIMHQGIIEILSIINSVQIDTLSDWVTPNYVFSKKS